MSGIIFVVEMVVCSPDKSCNYQATATASKKWHDFPLFPYLGDLIVSGL